MPERVLARGQMWGQMRERYPQALGEVRGLSTNLLSGKSWPG